jgi:predicted transcriptional regulator
VENLEESKKMTGAFSIFHPYISAYISFAKKGRDTSIIVTSQVYERIKEEFKDELRESFKSGNGSLYVCRELIEISYVVVTDKFLSLSLPFSDGTYDYQRDILCFDPASLKWGEELFAYYRDISEKVTEI